MKIQFRSVNGASSTGEERQSKRDLGTSPNALTAYIAELGEVPLLTRTEELELARCVESAEIEVARALLETRLGVDEVLSTVRALRDRPRDLTRRSTNDGADEQDARARVRRTLCALESLSRALRRGAPEHRLTRATRRAETAIRDLRPSRFFLDRTVCSLRSHLEAEPGAASTSLDPTSRGALESTLASVARAEREATKARGRLIQANVRLVVSIAKTVRYSGVQLLDRVQEGNIGLMKAVDKFDYQRGYRFSTYASFWIRQSISRGISDRGRTIRVPVHMVEVARRVAMTRRRIEVEQSHPPTVEELAEAIGIAADKVGIAVASACEPASLEAPVGFEGSRLGDFIEDPGTNHPFDAVSAKLFAEAAQGLLDKLTRREREVLRMRFGLGGERARTLAEIGRHMSLTRERIRQIEVAALGTLKRLAAARRLRTDLER